MISSICSTFSFCNKWEIIILVDVFPAEPVIAMTGLWYAFRNFEDISNKNFQLSSTINCGVLTEGSSIGVSVMSKTNSVSRPLIWSFPSLQAILLRLT